MVEKLDKEELMGRLECDQWEGGTERRVPVQGTMRVPGRRFGKGETKRKQRQEI